MNMIEISVLGPIHVKINGVSYTISGNKLRSLIVILAMAGGDLIHRDELIEELGLEQSMTKNVNAVHAHITRLRKWLQITCGAPELLVSESNGYRLGTLGP